MERSACEHCSKVVTTRQMKRHQTSKKCREVRGESELIDMIACPDCSKMVKTSYMPKHRCRKVVETLKKEVDRLGKKVQQVTVNNFTVVNNITNNNNLVIGPDVLSSIAEHFDLDALLDGSAFGTLVLACAPYGSLRASDPSRKNIRYTPAGESAEVLDHGCKGLTSKVFSECHPRATATYRRSKDDPDVSLDKLTVALRHLKSLDGAAKGNYDTKYTMKFINRVVNGSIPGAPQVRLQISKPEAGTGTEGIAQEDGYLSDATYDSISTAGSSYDFDLGVDIA